MAPLTVADPAARAVPAAVRSSLPPLPIDAVLPAVLAALAERTAAVLQAPPGAGKTTRVPLALLDAPWLDGGKVVMLEPRRLAARAAAHRMASLLGEQVGATVGHRIRLDTRVGPRTRIEVVTEGVLTRMLERDPGLEGVGAVLFDEFHERSLAADLGLALTLQTQAILRPALRLLVMSATLDGVRVAALLGRATGAPPAPVVTSAGRSFPVAVRWRERRPEPRPGSVEAAAAATVRQALAEHEGDVLAFLPGAAEIRRAAALLADAVPPDVAVRPLFGQMSQQEQDAAIAASPPGRRKVVLATSIAESSLTIEGVRVVVDAGLARVPRFSPRTGMAHLETVRVSRDSAEQRAGRAGRVAPGVCYRLWPEAEHHHLLARGTPEILDADLASLALELAVAGVREPAELHWLDLPPAAAFAQARGLVAELGALDADGRVTAHGRRMAALPVHPRLAHMILAGAALGWGAPACDLAALLEERDLLRGDAAGAPDPDLRLRLELVRGREVPATTAGWVVDRDGLHRVRQEARALRQALAGLARSGGTGRPTAGGDEEAAAPASAEVAGELLAFAYPDRIAQRREGVPGRYLLRHGGGAALAGASGSAGALAVAPYLVVAELGGGTAQDRPIRLAAPVELEALVRHHAAAIERVEEIGWDAAAGAVRARVVDRLGALVLRELPLRAPDGERVRQALLDAVRAAGVEALPWSDEARRLRERIAFVRGLAASDAARWPDVSDAALLAELDGWLGPHLTGVRRWDEVQRLPLAELLTQRLGWGERAELDRLAPTHVVVPSGSRVRVDYAVPDAPVLAVRLQELFGLEETPRVGGGRVPLTLHLLSPAHRPVQVTRDLAGFWRSSYFDVRRELRGRYPRHDWPENPIQAAPTRRAKPRS